MDNNFQYVMGDFEGYFYTLQKSAFTHNELPTSSEINSVNLYKGELTNVNSIDFYKPEEHLNRDGLYLHNVTNIQLHPGSNIPLTEKKIYDFQQVVLKNVEVVNSWEHNDKTYGILKGQMVGRIHKLSSIPNITDPSSPNIPPPPIGDKNDPKLPTEGGNKWIPPIFDNYKNKGCSRFWDVLKWILLLLILFFLFRSCNSCKNKIKQDDSNNSICCQSRDSLYLTLDSLYRVIDTLVDLNEHKNHEIDSLSNEAIVRVDSAGGKTGVITVSLIWNSIDDLDLALIEPSGKPINFANKFDNISNGELDIDNNNKNPLILDPVENIYIMNPLNGLYQVKVNWFKTNKSRNQIVEFYFVVRINGEVKYSSRATLWDPIQNSNPNNWTTFYEFNFPFN